MLIYITCSKKVKDVTSEFRAASEGVIEILMILTSIVSKQSDKIRSLTQTIGMLEKRIRELEEKDPK